MFPFSKKEKKLYKTDYDTTSIEQVFEMFEKQPRLIVKSQSHGKTSVILSSHDYLKIIIRDLIREIYKNQCYNTDEYAAEMEMVAIAMYCDSMRDCSIVDFDWKRKTRHEPAIIENDAPIVDDCGDELQPVILVRDKENNLYLIPKNLEESFDYTIENDPDFTTIRFVNYKIDDIKKVNLYFKPNF